MKSKIVLCVLMLGTVVGLVHADSLNLRVGAWQQTIVTTTAGTLIPAELLAKLPPARQRAVAAAAAARAKKPVTHEDKTCFTKEDITQDRILKDDDADDAKCATKIITKTATSLVVEKACTPPVRKMRGTFTAPTPETMHGVIDIVGEQGKVHVDMKGHWLGASCAGIEDRD